MLNYSLGIASGYYLLAVLDLGKLCFWKSQVIS